MIRLSLLFTTLLCTLGSLQGIHAQTIPNGDLETWPTDPNTGNRVPANWITFRTSAIRGTTAPQSGFAFATIQSVDFFGTLVPGILRNKFAVNRVPGYLNGYYRTSSNTATDSLYILVRVFSDTSLVGQAQQGTRWQTDTWIPFGIRIYNLNPSLTPDSMAINIYSYRDDPTAPGPSLYSIDNLTLGDTPIGNPLGTELFTTAKPSRRLGLSVVGNPSTGQPWEVALHTTLQVRYTLQNAAGAIVRRGQASGILRLDPADLPSGIYRLSLEGDACTSTRLALLR